MSVSHLKQIVSHKKYEQLEDNKKEVDLGSEDLNASQLTSPPPNPKLSLFRLILLCAPFIGIQFCWAIQSGYSTSTFLQLGMSKTVVSYAWLAGPVSGIIVQPIVGEFSDKSTSKWGRRRPYVVIGAVLVIVSLMIFGNSSELGKQSQGFALTLAVSSFWIHDMAINAIQGPARSMLPDIAPPEQLYLGNALIALMTGLGSLAGNYLGSVQLDKLFTFSSSQIQILYGIGAIVVATTVFAGVFSTKETPQTRPTAKHETDQLVRNNAQSDAILTSESNPPPNSYSIDDETVLTTDAQANEETVTTPNQSTLRRWFNPIIEVFYFLLNFPKVVRPIFAIQVCTWFGWFCLFIYGSVWVATEIYHGVADSGNQDEQDKFDAGVRTANLGLALQSVVAIVCAPILPWIINWFGMKWVYLTGQLVFAGCLVSPLFISSPAGAVVMLALLGIPWACATTIPWSFTILAVSPDQLARTGLLMATLNLSICFPQIVVSFIGSGLLVAWGSYAGVLATGGIIATIGAFLIVIFVTNRIATNVTQTQLIHAPH